MSQGKTSAHEADFTARCKQASCAKSRIDLVKISDSAGFVLAFTIGNAISRRACFSLVNTANKGADG
ncbi:MAG TPA: hypothetical protein VJ654_13405 [Noviherbaspirillum sp.]|nr:hypothetical protein [Noviherbaspirillum sp.]